MTHFMKAKIKKTVFYGFGFMASKWITIFLLYHSGFWSYWFLLLFPIADTIAAISAILYLKGNFRRYFAQILEENFENDAKNMLAEADEVFQKISLQAQLNKKSKNPLDKKLKLFAYFMAFIQILERKEIDGDEIRNLSKSVAIAYAAPKNRIHRWYLKLRPSFIPILTNTRFYRKKILKTQVKEHQLGFRAQVLTEKSASNQLGYAMYVFECGACQLLNHFKYHQYKDLMCEIDEILMEITGYQVNRKKSLIAGDEKCDFRFTPVIANI